MKLLSVSTDTKTIKGEKFGYLTGIMYLAPARVSGYNTCPMASVNCTNACIYTTGRGTFSNVQEARINKTKRYFEDRAQFMADLEKDILALKRKAKKQGLIPTVRLNGTSDLLGKDYLDLMRRHNDIKFYDYTAVLHRFSLDLPENYSLTFSRKEDNDISCAAAIQAGHNVAVVFETVNDQLPILWHGVPVVNGDESDLRFLDPKGVIVGLKAKGKAKKDTSGFVVRATDPNVKYL